MIITEENFELIAAKYYINPNCTDKEEFLEDFSRIKYIKRLFRRYRKTGELKERLILNHLVILFNVFENTGCQKLLFFKLQGNLDILKPFLITINRLPKKIEINNKTFYTSDISMDQNIVEILRKQVLCQQ
jgi:hypothetical protein